MPRSRSRQRSAERTPHRASPRPASPAWALAGVVALCALLWACRGAPAGTPAADDYDYIYSLRFLHPLDWFGPMDSLWYWRPLSRQAYFSAFDRLFFSAPGVVAAFHAGLLLLAFALAYRIARRVFEPAAAVAIATFPLLAEPTRALYSWPTGAQPLIAIVCVLAAVESVLARRIGIALVALLGALLSHEQAFLAALFVPAIAIARARDRGEKMRWALGTAVVTALVLAGRIVAASHGSGLPARAPFEAAAQAVGPVVLLSLEAQLDLAGLPDNVGTAVRLAYAAVALAALGLFARRAARETLWQRLPVLLAGSAWFALSILPLAFAGALWNPRHTSLPGLGLAFALVGLIACASVRLALAFAGVRLVALLLAPTVPAVIAQEMSPATTPLSFLHIARMQKTADSARRTLLAAHPTLPAGTVVRYWSLPRETQIAFSGPRAVRTWYADSTLKWEFWEHLEPVAGPPAKVVLGFNVDVADPAVLVEPQAVALYDRALRTWSDGDLRAADAQLANVLAAQATPVLNLTSEIVRLRARLAYGEGNFARADSLNGVDRRLTGESASYWGLRALLRLQAGDRAGARVAAQKSLAIRPGDAEGTEAMRTLDATPGAEEPAKGSPTAP